MRIFLLLWMLLAGFWSMGAEVVKPSFAIMVGDTAIITDADLVEYRFAEHALVIRGDALTRLARMRPSMGGVTFQVMANGERMYSGRFTSIFSSMTYREPTIAGWVETNQPTATIFIRGPAYQEPQFQTGPDPRGDVRIARALAALGKLRAGFPGGASHDEAFTLRVAELLTECQKLKPGTTRAEFDKVFELEGGLVRGTFVHRHCRYLKVDVEFTSSEPLSKAARPADRIAKISKPYLAWSVVD